MVVLSNEQVCNFSEQDTYKPYNEAINTAQALFNNAGNAANMPTVELEDADFVDGKMDVCDALVKAELCISPPARSV